MCLSGYSHFLELRKLPFTTAQIHLELQFLCRTAHYKKPWQLPPFESAVIDSFFLNSRRRPSPSWILKFCEFCTSCQIGSVVIKLRTKTTNFGSNISYSHWDRHTLVPEVHLMTSRELTSGLDFWSRDTFLESSFASQMACLYLEPFKSNKASNLTILKMSLQQYLELWRTLLGGDRPCHTFSRVTFASQIVCLIAFI